MDQINLRGEAGEEERFFGRGIAAADHANRHVAIKCAIAGRATRQAVANQLLFVLQPEIAGGGAARDDQRLGVEPFVVGLQADMAVGHFQIRRFRVRKTRAEMFRLLVHVHDQLRAVDAFRKARKIFDQSRGGKLAAGLATLEHERAQVRPSGINRRRQTRATASDNDNFFHARQG